MNYTIISILKKIPKRLFQVGIVLFLLSLVYFFYQPQLSIFNFNIHNPFYVYINTMEWWLYLVIYLIIVGIINIVVLSILNLCYTLIRSRNANLKIHYETLFAEYLMEYLFPKENNNSTSSELIMKMKKQTKTRIQIVTFFSTCDKIQEIVDLDLSDQFMELTDTLNLNKHIKKLLYSNDFGNKILALKIISYLKINTFNSILIKFSKSNNYVLRLYAINALIIILKNDDLSLIAAEYSRDLSILDVNIIVNSILKNQDLNSNLEPLLKSENPKKVLIAVLIAKHRNKIELKNIIKELIGHPYEVLNLALWDTYIQLEKDTSKTIGFIINNLKDQSETIKTHIFSKEIIAYDEKYNEFLVSMIKNDESLAVKTKAMSLLFNYNFDLISQFVDTTDEKISKAYKENTNFYN